MSKAILLISHGSYSAKTIAEVKSLVKILKDKSGLNIFEFAFLEIEQPSIPKGIDLCVNKGAEEIVVLLNFLNAGKHVDEDIPRIIEEARHKYPDISIRITSPVGQHPRVSELFVEMI